MSACDSTARIGPAKVTDPGPAVLPRHSQVVNHGSWWFGVQRGPHIWGRSGLRVQGWVHGQVQATPVIFVLVLMEHTD
jgi:hypothetical protein